MTAPQTIILGSHPKTLIVWRGHTPTQSLGWGLTPSGEVVKGYHPNPTSGRRVLGQPKHQIIWGPTPTQVSRWGSDLNPNIRSGIRPRHKFHDGGQTSTQTPDLGSDPNTSSTMGSDPNPNSSSGVIPLHGVKNEYPTHSGDTSYL